MQPKPPQGAKVYEKTVLLATLARSWTSRIPWKIAVFLHGFVSAHWNSADFTLTQHNLRVVFARTSAKNCLICQDCHNSPAMHDVLVAGQLSPHGHGTLCQGPQQRQWLSCCSHGCWYGFCATWQARDCRLARTSVDKDALFMTQIESMIRSRGTAILPPVSLKCFKSKARKAFQCVRDHRGHGRESIAMREFGSYVHPDSWSTSQEAGPWWRCRKWTRDRRKNC